MTFPLGIEPAGKGLVRLTRGDQAQGLVDRDSLDRALARIADGSAATVVGGTLVDESDLAEIKRALDRSKANPTKETSR